VSELEALFGVEVSGVQRHQVRVYLETLSRWNRRINLTSIDLVEEQLRLSFFEAFWAAKLFVGEGTQMADIGSGAGFPGVPIKIFRSSVEMTLIEPSGKKAVFLEEGCRAAGIDVKVFGGRAEDFAGWDGIGLASVRALRLSPLLERLLRKSSVQVLVFHGRAADVNEERFVLMRREGVPGSANRFVSLYVPRVG
jgi:16S rRNA (guanine527-N7)-methyltransferase